MTVEEAKGVCKDRSNMEEISAYPKGKRSVDYEDGIELTTSLAVFLIAGMHRPRPASRILVVRRQQK
jgi:hypothetical protein